MNGGPRTSRIEHDLLGAREVPGDAYFGIHTVRAIENFRVSGVAISVHPELIWSLTAVKEAAAMANRDLGELDPVRAGAIVAACREIRAGDLRDQFRVDVFQGGAGTSTNMNVNEVIANRALELLGRRRGDYDFLHPLDHVNAAQSTNDVYPTAARIALDRAAGALNSGLARLRMAFEERADEFADLRKMGRTQLQDAVPMTVGQELSAYALTIHGDELRLDEARSLLREINLGGTAIGTGLNAPDGYRTLACDHLASIAGVELLSSPNLIEATQDCGVFISLSAALKRAALKLSKTCNDLRLLSSGPEAGFGEINLPPLQAGSSAMPGKVNPVIPELVNQVAFDIAGHDVTVGMAAEAGQLQLNAFEPVIVHRLLEGLSNLTAASTLLAERCVAGITVNRGRLSETLAGSTGRATVLAPYLGYAAASALSREAIETGRDIFELAVDRDLIDVAQLEAILRASRFQAALMRDETVP